MALKIHIFKNLMFTIVKYLSQNQNIVYKMF